MPQTHKMNLEPYSYGQILSGKKSIEVRLYDDKRMKIKIGDIIEFTNNFDHDVVSTKVVDMSVFGTFKELVDKYPVSEFGFDDRGVLLDTIYRFYSREDEARFGVVGIHIVLNKN
jgi:ASC-1-like (ASCH) protein